MLSYIQEGVAEVWKNNLLNELSKGELGVKTMEKLFTKMRNKFKKIAKEKQKIE